MGESGRISSSTPRVGTTESLIGTAIKGIPPILKRFYKFTREMARHFSRHLSKDRAEEFVDAVIKEFK